MTFDLTEEETTALAKLLRDAIDADRFPLSRRVQTLKGILAKIRPEPMREPLPPPKVYAPPRAGRRRERLSSTNSPKKAGRPTATHNVHAAVGGS